MTRKTEPGRPACRRLSIVPLRRLGRGLIRSPELNAILARLVDTWRHCNVTHLSAGTGSLMGLKEALFAGIQSSLNAPPPGMGLWAKSNRFNREHHPTSWQESTHFAPGATIPQRSG